MAAAAMRTFAKVKSSAIMPRHPSVPNLMGCDLPCFVYLCIRCHARSRIVRDSLRYQFLHHFAHILRVFARGDQQGIVCLDDHEVVHAHQRNELLRTVYIIATRIDEPRCLRPRLHWRAHRCSVAARADARRAPPRIRGRSSRSRQAGSRDWSECSPFAERGSRIA